MYPVACTTTALQLELQLYSVTTFLRENDDCFSKDQSENIITEWVLPLTSRCHQDYQKLVKTTVLVCGSFYLQLPIDLHVLMALTPPNKLASSSFNKS